MLTIERPDGTIDYAPGVDDCIPADGSVIVYGSEDQITRLCDQLRCEFDPEEGMGAV